MKILWTDGYYGGRSRTMKVPIYRIAKFVSYIFLTGVVAVSFVQFEFVHVSNYTLKVQVTRRGYTYIYMYIHTLEIVSSNSNSGTYIMPSGKRIPCEITPTRNLNDLT